MDKSSKKQILVGLFVMLGIVLFVVGIFLVGSKDAMFKKTFIITARFANASGLKKGSKIRYNGVSVGIVKSVNLINDTLVQVDMQIEEKSRRFITSKAVASIASDGLMGDKMVNIVNASKGGRTIRQNEVIQSNNPINTDKAFQTLNESNENIRIITRNLKSITANLDNENGTIQQLFRDTDMAHSLRMSLYSLRTSLNTLNGMSNKVLIAGGNLQEITARVRNGNGTLGMLVNDNTIGKELQYTVQQLQTTSIELNKMSQHLSRAVHQVDSGDGAVALLLTDTAFAGDMRQSMINIRNASEGLNENMEALKHSFLLRKYFEKKKKP